MNRIEQCEQLAEVAASAFYQKKAKIKAENEKPFPMQWFGYASFEEALKKARLVWLGKEFFQSYDPNCNYHRSIAAHNYGAHRLLPATSSRFKTISALELRILAFAVRGLNNREISEILQVGRSTMDYHWKSIRNKLGTHDLFVIGLMYAAYKFWHGSFFKELEALPGFRLFKHEPWWYCPSCYEEFLVLKQEYEK